MGQVLLDVCSGCGSRRLRTERRLGRTVPYRAIPQMPVPASFAVPRCQDCGLDQFTHEVMRRLMPELKPLYQKLLRDQAQRLIAKITPHCSMRQLAVMLGLSVDYISRIKCAVKAPSGELICQLALLASNPPERLQELRTFWSEDCEQLLGVQRKPEPSGAAAVACTPAPKQAVAAAGGHR